MHRSPREHRQEFEELGYTLDQLADVVRALPDDLKETYGLHPRHLRAV